MTAADNLLRTLQQARAPMQRQLPTFLPLAERVERAFAGMALAEDPRDPTYNRRALILERDIIAWYLDRQQLLQAIAVAYEWLLSYIMNLEGYQDLYFGPDRDTVRKQVTALNKARVIEARGKRVNPKLANDVKEAQDNLHVIVGDAQLLSLYEEVADLRNDLLHAAKTVHDDPTPADWETYIRDACRKVAALPLAPSA